MKKIYTFFICFMLLFCINIAWAGDKEDAINALGDYYIRVIDVCFVSGVNGYLTQVETLDTVSNISQKAFGKGTLPKEMQNKLINLATLICSSAYVCGTDNDLGCEISLKAKINKSINDLISERNI